MADSSNTRANEASIVPQSQVRKYLSGSFHEADLSKRSKNGADREEIHPCVITTKDLSFDTNAWAPTIEAEKGQSVAHEKKCASSHRSLVGNVADADCAPQGAQCYGFSLLMEKSLDPENTMRTRSELHAAQANHLNTGKSHETSSGRAQAPDTVGSREIVGDDHYGSPRVSIVLSSRSQPDITASSEKHGQNKGIVETSKSAGHIAHLTKHGKSSPQNPSNTLDPAQYTQTSRKKQRILQGDIEECAHVHEEHLCSDPAADAASHEQDEIASPVRRKRRRKQYKKPKDMPRRPLSAYNIFFREERAKILPQLQASRSPVLEGDGKTPKNHHGLFSTMGRTIAARWNTLDPNEKQKYEAQAKLEMKRYQLEMLEYRAKMVLPVDPGSNDDECNIASSPASLLSKERNSMSDNFPKTFRLDGGYVHATPKFTTCAYDDKSSKTIYDGRSILTTVHEEQTKGESNRIIPLPEKILSVSNDGPPKQDHSSLQRLGITARFEVNPQTSTSSHVPLSHSTTSLLSLDPLRHLGDFLAEHQLSSLQQQSNSIHNTIAEGSIFKDILDRLLENDKLEHMLREQGAQRSQEQQILGALTESMHGLDTSSLPKSTLSNSSSAATGSRLLDSAAAILANERSLLDHLTSKRASLESTNLAILDALRASRQHMGGISEELKILLQGPRILSTMQRWHPHPSNPSLPSIADRSLLNALLQINRGSINQHGAQPTGFQTGHEISDGISLLRTVLLSNQRTMVDTSVEREREPYQRERETESALASFEAGLLLQRALSGNTAMGPLSSYPNLDSPKNCR